MTEHKVEASAETFSHARRQVLKLLSTAACGAFAMGVAGCAQKQAQERERPDWMRSKQGSNGNGHGRK
jgi:hypothetical protein